MLVNIIIIKCEIALSRIETDKQRGVRFGHDGIDGNYVKSLAFLRGIDKLGCTFVADVHCRRWFILKTQCHAFLPGMAEAGNRNS